MLLKIAIAPAASVNVNQVAAATSAARQVDSRCSEQPAKRERDSLRGALKPTPGTVDADGR